MYSNTVLETMKRRIGQSTCHKLQDLYHQRQDEQLWAKKVQSFLDARTLIFTVSTVQQNGRVCRPCMTILRDATAHDWETLGDVAWVAEESKRENVNACETYAHRSHTKQLSSPSRDLASLGIKPSDCIWPNKRARENTLEHQMLGKIDQ